MLAVGTRLQVVDAAGREIYSQDLRPDAPSPALPGTECPGLLMASLVLDEPLPDGQFDPDQGERALLAVSARWRDASGAARSLVALLAWQDAAAPQLLWRHDDLRLPALADPLAPPTLARLALDATQRDPRHWVVWLGAGLARPASTTDPSSGRDGAALLALDAADGRLLWRAGAGIDAARWPAMTQPMTGGLRALDLDADGLLDRLYAGDGVARLWRFDVLPGNTAAERLAGRVMADLADPTAPRARLILAAPDAARLQPAGQPARLAVTVGTATAATASPGTGTMPPVGNLLAVVHDPDPFTTLDAAAHARRPALTLADLPPVDPTGDASTSAPAGSAGYHLLLGPDQVLVRSLTWGGLLLFSRVEGLPPADADSCRGLGPTVIVKVGAIDALTGRIAQDLDGNGRRDAGDLAVPLPTGTTLAASELPRRDPVSGQCLWASIPLADCPALPRVRSLYWRRQDAD
jgi:Tfp pilus tip-associated adhesin PilY1